MTTRVSNAIVLAGINAALALLDVGVANGPGGSGQAYIEVRTGAQPADPSAAATGTLLGTLIASATAFAAAVDTGGAGRATANAVTADTAADAAGTAGWFRVYDSDAVAHIDGNVTATAGGGDMEIDNVLIALNDTIAVTLWTYGQSET